MTDHQSQSRPLSGRVAIVTGAGSGIGRAEAMMLAALGAKVVVNDLARGEPPSAEIVAEQIRRAGGDAIAANASVSSIEGAESIVQAAIARYERLDILVNNAGFGRVAPIWLMSEKDWDSVIAVNLKGTFAMARAAIPHMIAQKSGVIVNTSSEAGTGETYLGGYAAAKEGVVGLTRAIAREVARYGVRCNAVRPRAFDTAQGTAAGYEKFRRFARKFGRPLSGTHPMGPIPGRAEEVASIVAWLCTDECSGANGRVFLAGAGEVGLWEEPRTEKSFFDMNGWNLERLTAIRDHMFSGVRNEFAELPSEALEIIDERAAAYLKLTESNRRKM